MDFWQQVGASALGELIGGGIVALVIGGIVSEVLGVRQWAKERQEESRRQAESALKYIELLEEEIRGLLDYLPKAKKLFMAGDHVLIVTPVWDAVRAGGEFARVAEPKLVSDTAYFYEIVGAARFTVDLWTQRLFVGGAGAGDALLRAALDGAVTHMEKAEEQGKALIESYKDEKVRVRGLLRDR